jgi:dTDP-4-dehydro-6-deoxy-alpha-D-glucopyranose 2,3-dehydratase
MLKTEEKIEPIINWLQERLNSASFEVKEIPLSELKEWHYDDKQGSLVHHSGKFFSIRGIEVKTDYGFIPRWTQPIIDQPEIGILGILSKRIDGRRKYLMQAKMEPGNINILQLSPTVQATKSNYSQVHKGKKTNYLEYFTHPSDSEILMDMLQYEQGGRFYRKLNRNVLIDIKDHIPVFENYHWMTSGEIGLLLNMNNAVNMDSRSVLSCMLKKDAYENPVNTGQEISDWLSMVQTRYNLETKWIALDKLDEWHFDGNHIKHKNEKYFSVIGVETTAGNREVKSWRQPILKEISTGLTGFIIKEINQTTHYLLQVIIEAGKTSVKFAPTVQCSDYKNRCGSVKYMDRLLNGGEILYDRIQSEEGGRFYHFQNRNMIVRIEDDIEAGDDFIWVTYNQILDLISHIHLNIEARTLMACWNSIKNNGGYKYD